MGWMNSSSSGQQTLNPHAPEFRPSVAVALPPPFQPRQFIHHHHHPSVLYQEYSVQLTPPPYPFTLHYYYLNPPPPQPTATPPTQPPLISWRYTNTNNNSEIARRRERGNNYVIRRSNTINYYSRPPTSRSTFEERDHHDYHYNYNHHRQRQRQRSSFSNSARRIQSAPPVAVNQGGHETTLMIRNIPNNFTREMLIRFLDDFCNRENLTNQDVDHQEAVEFDFVYLPIDFRTKMNKGYAFVNFTTPNGVWRLQEANIKDQTWGFGDSIKKRREIALAKIQGKNALIQHFEQSRFVCDSEEYLPVCFSPARDGSQMKQVSQRNIGHRLQQQTTTSTSTSSSRRKPSLSNLH